jgi:hypothetical protein
MVQGGALIAGTACTVGFMEPVDCADPGNPPRDAELWTDDQWLAWLKATDGQAVGNAADTPAPLSSRITQSVGGQMLGNAMLGLAQVIYGQKQEEVIIVAEGNSEPEQDEPFAVSLNQEHPEKSVVVFRPSHPHSSSA